MRTTIEGTNWDRDSVEVHPSRVRCGFERDGKFVW